MKVTNIIGAAAGAIFRVVAAIVIVYVIYRGVGICYDYGYRIFTESAVSTGEGRTVTVSITAEMSPWDIGELFGTRSFLRCSIIFPNM